MKKIATTIVFALSLASIPMSAAHAERTVVTSTSYCIIEKDFTYELSSAEQLRSPKLTFTVSDIKCPDGVVVSMSNFFGQANPYELEDGEWGITTKDWPGGIQYGVGTRINIERKSATIDPATGSKTWDSCDPSSLYGCEDLFSDIDRGELGDDFEWDRSPYDMQKNGGSWNVSQGKNAFTYLIFQKDGAVTRYPLKFAKDIKVKYLSTVKLVAKKLQKTVTITANTSRNRSVHFLDGRPFGKQLKAYKNDYATLYIDGKRFSTEKIGSNGTASFKLNNVTKVRSYTVTIAENAVNFAGSSTIRK